MGWGVKRCNENENEIGDRRSNNIPGGVILLRYEVCQLVVHSKANVYEMMSFFVYLSAFITLSLSMGLRRRLRAFLPPHNLQCFYL